MTLRCFCNVIHLCILLLVSIFIKLWTLLSWSVGILCGHLGSLKDEYCLLLAMSALVDVFWKLVHAEHKQYKQYYVTASSCSQWGVHAKSCRSKEWYCTWQSSAVLFSAFTAFAFIYVWFCFPRFSPKRRFSSVLQLYTFAWFKYLHALLMMFLALYR